LTTKLKQAEARAEFAERSVQKLQKEVDRLEGEDVRFFKNHKLYQIDPLNYNNQQFLHALTEIIRRIRGYEITSPFTFYFKILFSECLLLFSHVVVCIFKNLFIFIFYFYFLTLHIPRGCCT